MKQYLYLLLLFFAWPMVAAASPVAAQGQGELALSPAAIEIGARFDGTALQVQGAVPAGSELVLRLTGAPADLHLREKGKVFGLLWMNVGQITLKNVPDVMLITASKPLAELGAAAAPFSLAGIAGGILYDKGAGAPDIDVPHELLLLKQNAGLYNEAKDGVRLGPNEGNSRSFTADLAIPSSLPPGAYTVEAIAVKDGAVASRQTAAIKAELVGFPKSLSDIAFKKSLLYGIGATVIALVSGLLIGLIFQSKGAH